MSRPKGNPTDIAPVEPWEYDLIMPHFPKHWQLFYEILWQIGPRVSEALGIVKTDIEKDGVWITSNKRKDHLRLLLPLTPELYERLKAYAHYVRGSRVFPYTAAGAWFALRDACVTVAKDYPGFRTSIHPHSFRHSVGYRVSGANLGLTSLAQQVTVQHVLRHKNLATAERYFNPPPATVINAIKKINEPVKLEVPQRQPDPEPPPPAKPTEKVDWIDLVEQWRKENK